MSAFREHFLDKYFGYRRRYVRAVAELAPNRRRLAVVSEIARLGFSFTACALVIVIMGALFVAALRAASWWNVAYFGLILAMPLVFAGFSLAGLRDAWLDRSNSRAGGA